MQSFQITAHSELICATPKDRVFYRSGRQEEHRILRTLARLHQGERTRLICSFCSPQTRRGVIDWSSPARLPTPLGAQLCMCAHFHDDLFIAHVHLPILLITASLQAVNNMDTEKQTSTVRQSTRSPWKARYFVDTEFTDFLDCQLISVAIVGEDGREFYGESTDFDSAACSEFVRAAVLPQLGQMVGRSMPSAQLREELRAWLAAVPTKPQPILCFDYQGDLDLLYDLLDGDMPNGWKREHIGNKLDAAQREAYFRAHGGRHHALHDARANACAFC